MVGYGLFPRVSSLPAGCAMIGRSMAIVLMLGSAAAHAAAPATTTAPTVREVGHVQARKLTEASGIVASPNHPGIFWTHNDGGDGVLYAIHLDGSDAGQVPVQKKPDDWEDITADENGDLYQADVGNNNRQRTHLVVRRIKEPDPDQKKYAPVEQTWKLKFPDKPFDCESLFLFDGYGYVIPKLHAGRAELYRFPLKSAKKTSVLEKLFELPIDHPITAASLNKDASVLAVLTRGGLDLFQIDGKIEKITAATPTHIELPPVQTEGCCFTPEGIVVIAETGEIYLVQNALPATRP